MGSVFDYIDLCHLSNKYRDPVWNRICLGLLLLIISLHRKAVEYVSSVKGQPFNVVTDLNQFMGFSGQSCVFVTGILI